MNENPAFTEIVPAEERSPRERMIAIADGYFSRCSSMTACFSRRSTTIATAGKTAF